MKKNLLILTLFSIIIFSGCAKTETTSSNQTEKSSQIVSSTTTGALTQTEASSITTVSENKDAIDSNNLNGTTSNSYQEQTSATQLAPSNTVTITTVEQAKQRIIDTQPEVSNPDLTIHYYMQLGSDFLFSVTSSSIAQQGGSGSAGFYRVNSDGEVLNTDSYGNSFNN